MWPSQANIQASAWQNDGLTAAHHAQYTKPASTNSSWACPFCNASFTSKKSQMEHMQEAHDATKKVRCTICSRMLSCAQSLRIHMVTHTGAQKYHCSICDKRFTQKHHYKGHMNSHAGARPFQCDRCLRCYTYYTHMTSHRKTCSAIPDPV